MAKYVMWGHYCEDVLERRVPHRQAHLEGLAEQKQAGLLVTLGPTEDLSMVFGIYEAADETTVRRLVEADPYWKHGIWTEYEVRAWIQAF
ncbi:MAG: YciI family protein [Synechococcales cyanobacterium RU_4_20]|nr:YciI family protein [Synechococcales cyanobacterium RU_4_20]NJR69173.1 YciI family protein [Synechococcales cyanobacterium CRU_2_2]